MIFKRKDMSLLKPSCPIFLENMVLWEEMKVLIKWTMSLLIWACRILQFLENHKKLISDINYQTIWLTYVICLMSTQAWWKTKENTVDLKEEKASSISWWILLIIYLRNVCSTGSSRLRPLENCRINRGQLRGRGPSSGSCEPFLL